MGRVIDYFFGPLSPWTYLGHQRFAEIARAAQATVRVRPMDLNAVFAVSGGLPLGQRPAQRQAYRLVELQRFSKELRVPMNLHPRYFPVPADLAAKLIVAVALHDGETAAMQLSGALFAALWAQERDISDPVTLGELLRESGLSARRMDQASSPDIHARYEENTRQAIEMQVFGSPSYVIDGEIFWGQDRLDFVRRTISTPGAAQALP